MNFWDKIEIQKQIIALKKKAKTIDKTNIEALSNNKKETNLLFEQLGVKKQNKKKSIKTTIRNNGITFRVSSDLRIKWREFCRIENINQSEFIRKALVEFMMKTIKNKEDNKKNERN